MYKFWEIKSELGFLKRDGSIYYVKQNFFVAKKFSFSDRLTDGCTVGICYVRIR